jgi:hypothetical protein
MNSRLALPNEGQSGTRVLVGENREIHSASHVALRSKFRVCCRLYGGWNAMLAVISGLPVIQPQTANLRHLETTLA